MLHPDVTAPAAAPLSGSPYATGPEPPAGDTSTIPSTAANLTDTFRLAGSQWVIGRDRDCALRVRAERIDISRRHATIQLQGGRYILLDHSRHGTLVNEAPITRPCRLDTGDVIGLATTVAMLRFVDYDQVAFVSQSVSRREREVLAHLSAGLTIKQIADALVISQNTVQTHLRHLYVKLEVNSREDAVARARKLQLLHQP